MRKTYSSLESNFFEFVTPKSEIECWEWTGPRDERGRGYMSEKRPGRPKTLRAHRFSYEFYIGPIPDGFVVRHRCDNPKCCNPAHLCVGTQRDNIDDRVSRGRTRTSHALQKLTDASIAEIRRLSSEGMKQRDIAKVIGVCQRTVNKVVRRLDGYARY